MSITANEHRRCAACREPSKRPVGCWDGVDEKTGKFTGGFTFTCKNKCCPTFKKMRAAEQEAKRREAAAAEENQKNGTDPDVFLELRRKCRLTLYQVSQMAGVSSSTVSAWETGREPFPADKYLEICRCMREMIGRKEEGVILTYNGSPQPPSWNKYDPEQLTQEITAQTSTGIYTAKFTLKGE